MLTESSYALIIGAGAGKPYGFPLGEELYQFICNNYAQYVGADAYAQEVARDFSEELKLTSGVSIDRYLNINKKLKDIGVHSIATVMHFFEHNSIQKLPLNNPSVEGDWYTYLYKKMIQGLDTPKNCYELPKTKYVLLLSIMTVHWNIFCLALYMVF